MHEKHLYEYAVIRVVPRVEREEFVNVGIILFSKKAKYINIRYHINEERIRAMAADFDIDILRACMESFVKVCTCAKDGGDIAQFDIPERFRWLTAVRSASVQTSRPHPGFSGDLDKTVDDLFKELVL